MRPAPEENMAAWAIEGLYKNIGVPVSVELANKLGKLKSNEKEIVELFKEARLRLGERKELDNDKDFEIALESVFVRLEPAARPAERSRYIDPSVLIRLGGAGQLNPVSVGLKLRNDSRTGLLTVETPLLNGPAYKAGIFADDVISHITIHNDAEGEPLPQPVVHATKGMTVDQANALLLGRGRTRVTLTVIRN